MSSPHYCLTPSPRLVLPTPSPSPNGQMGGGGRRRGRLNGAKAGDEEEELDEGDEDALRKMGILTHRRPGMRKGRVRSGALSGGPKKVESMESSMRRKSRKMASPSTEVSITQAMQNTMRKYALERRLFQQLLELKRIQIRNTRANEHVLIKRMVDGFQKEGALLGLRGYAGPYNFNSYEKYLYDQLRFLQSTQGVKIPTFRPTDDVEKLSRAIRRAEIKELPDPLHNDLDAHSCNHTTHRCHHAAHAYTGIPCAAYIGYRKKRPLTTTINNNKQVSLPKIPGTQPGGEGGIGGRVRQGEPVGLRNYDPKNPLTVELQPSSPKIKEQPQTVEEEPPERSTSAPEIMPSDASAEPDSLAVDTLAPETRQDLHSAPVETRTEA